MRRGRWGRTMIRRIQSPAIRCSGPISHNRVDTKFPSSVLRPLISQSTSSGTHIDGDELENSVLRQDADNRLFPRLVILINQRQPPRVRPHQCRTRVRQRLVRMNRDGRWRRDVDSLLNLCPPNWISFHSSFEEESGLTAERTQLKGLNLGRHVLVLVRREVVVLNEVHDVRQREHACKSLCRRVVQRRRYHTYITPSAHV